VGFSDSTTSVGNGDLTTVVALLALLWICVEFGRLRSVGLLMLLPVGSVCSPNSVSEFGRADGWSRTDSDPWSPTEPKRRSLGKAVDRATRPRAEVIPSGRAFRLSEAEENE